MATPPRPRRCPVNAVRVRVLVRKGRAEGVTTVITTHDILIGDAICDGVAFVVDGGLAECEAPTP